MTYLLLNIFTMLCPVALSFDKKVAFYKKWKYLIFAIIPVAYVFLIWDHIFTKKGIWGFNEEYLVGINISNLPLEEVLFFITVPFACVFIYQVLIEYFPNLNLSRQSKWFFTILGLTMLILAGIYSERAYTSVNFLASGSFILIAVHLIKNFSLSHFFLAYLIHLIPFGIINGILTDIPIVWYNDTENLGIRLYSIPIEDTMYSLLLFSGNVVLYEFFKKVLKNNQN